ncbi:MAG TPA: CoA transferase [Pseudonocardia sp.]|jgi:crotonobetainyl-CoA:carnitine CoA-transferase CaiB-like acyl-CoA transferase
MTQALHGVRIVDLTSGVAGTSATKLLASLGADVVKIENPDGGDLTRNLVPYVFEAYNGGKRSVTLDLRTVQGRDQVRRLVGSSDVLVQSMRPGAIEKLGLGREEMAALNPRLIYASFSAFGSSGPASRRRGVDAVAQAESGLAVVQGRTLDNVSHVDVAGGLALSQGILAALMLRERTGEVEHVEVNLLDTAIYLQSAPYAEFSATGSTFGQQAFDQQFPAVGIFDAIDGPIYIAAYWQRDWKDLCQVVGRPGLVEDPRFVSGAARAANRDALRVEITDALRARPRREWVRELEASGILAGEARSYGEVLADEQVAHNCSFEEVTMDNGIVARIPRRPFQLNGRPAPDQGGARKLGADNHAVLDELNARVKKGDGDRPLAASSHQR